MANETTEIILIQQEQDQLQSSLDIPSDVSAEQMLLQPPAAAAITTTIIPSIYSTSNAPSNLLQNIARIKLIWYDPNIDENEDDTMETIKELKTLNYCIKTYIDKLECIDYIKSVKTDIKILLIVFGPHLSSILKDVDELRQVDSVYGFDLHTNIYPDPSVTPSKLIGSFSECKDLTDALKENIMLIEEQLEKFSFYDQQQKSARNLSKESAAFLWFQMFKDLILQMPRNIQAKQQLLLFCESYHRGNTSQLRWIKEFHEKYKPEEAITWYTKSTFLYKIVNKALRTEDVEQLYIFRFFIADLSLCLAKKFQTTKQNGVCLSKLYRGVKVNEQQFLLLKQSEQNLISTNGFFSTTRRQDVALIFAGTNTVDEYAIVFEVECDSSKLGDAIVFADISEQSDNPDEEEVLFDIGATFKVLKVFLNITLNVWIIEMQTTDEGAELGKQYIELNRKEIDGETSVKIMFGKLLYDMGRYDQSLKYFQTLLADPEQDEDIARIHNEIGTVYDFKGEFDQAIENYDKSYELLMHSTPSRVQQTARPLSNKAIILWRQKRIDDALELYNRALKITKDYYGKEHVLTAIALVNIGIIYEDKEQYKRSLKYHQKALKIYRKGLPRDHINTASTLVNLGSVYLKQHKLNRALKCFKKSLKIYQKLFSSEHHYIAASLNGIASVRVKQGRLDEALVQFSKALDIQEKHLGESNGSSPDRAITLRSIGEVYEKQLNNTTALDYYQRALEMISKLPANDPERSKLNERITFLNSNETSASVHSRPNCMIRSYCFCCSK